MGTQRISCDCNHQCNNSNTIDPYEFYVGDSFKIRYKFVNNNFSPSILIPLDSFDVTITYYIKGNESTTFIAKKVGRITDNCLIYPDHSIIKVIFDNYTLPAGYLYADFNFTYYDPEMGDHLAESTKTQFTNIVLKDTAE